MASPATFLRQAKVAPLISPTCTPRIANLEIIETVGAITNGYDKMIHNSVRMTARSSNTREVSAKLVRIDKYRHWPVHEGSLQRISVLSNINCANYHSLGNDNIAG
jgi:hypothetical protein